MRIGVPKETAEGERRVALIPDVVKSLKESGLDVMVESGAGTESGHPDPQYTEAGAEVGGADAAWGADMVLRVAVPSSEEIGRLRSGQIVIGHLAPLTSAETTKALQAAGVTSFAMEAIPRITRAQDDGRAQLAGQRRRLRRRAAGGARGGALLPDDDHRGRDGCPREGAGARRRRRRPAGDRDRNGVSGRS